MKLSEMLMEWAEENDLHEPGNGPCHCDICQKFVPAAIEIEMLLINWRQTENTSKWQEADRELWHFAGNLSNPPNNVLQPNG